LDWLRWAELDALVNLLAGQTKMGDVSLAPAKQFLQQGLQKLSPTAAESADGDEIMQSIVKCGLLSETVNLLMLRSRADDAQAVVEQWRSSLVPISAAAPWADEWLRQSRISLRLSEAELLQCRSEFQQAVDCYETILTDIKSEVRPLLIIIALL
jgi:hypothetical protein